MTTTSAPHPGLSAADTLAHFRAQNDYLDRMQELLEAQRQKILARDHQGILASSAALEELVASRHILERSRAKILAGAAEQLGCEPEQVVLSAMVELFDGSDDADRVREASDKLRADLDRVTAFQRGNNEMLHQENRFVTLMLSALGHDAGLYSPPHRQRIARPSATLDLRG